jgi:hypothetical protein
MSVSRRNPVMVKNVEKFLESTIKQSGVMHVNGKKLV